MREAASNSKVCHKVKIFLKRSVLNFAQVLNFFFSLTDTILDLIFSSESVMYNAYSFLM